MKSTRLVDIVSQPRFDNVHGGRQFFLTASGIKLADVVGKVQSNRLCRDFLKVHGFHKLSHTLRRIGNEFQRQGSLERRRKLVGKFGQGLAVIGKRERRPPILGRTLHPDEAWAIQKDVVVMVAVIQRGRHDGSRRRHGKSRKSVIVFSLSTSDLNLCWYSGLYVSVNYPPSFYAFIELGEYQK